MHSSDEVTFPSKMEKPSTDFLSDGQSPMTASTEASSDDGASQSEFDSSFNPFTQAGQSQSVRKNSGGKTESGWKRKVKTELCKFWLNGMACENQLKEQGCGFAHG